jgi:hypothetical protein
LFNYNIPNIVECELNDTKIQKDQGGIYRLTIDDDEFMSESLVHLTSTKEFYGCYEISRGHVLTSGLGFGIFPTILSQKDDVERITVVEKNKNVIDLFKENNKYSKKINIVNDDINIFSSTYFFDTIVLDHYESESYGDQIENMRQIHKNIPNHRTFYSWRIEKIYVELMLNGEFSQIEKKNDWGKFKKVLQIDSLPNLSHSQLKDFCSMYINGEMYNNKNN